MLCSKLLVAHVPHFNNCVPFPLITQPTVLTWWCTCSLQPVLEKCHHNCLLIYLFIILFNLYLTRLICPLYFSYGSDLVYRENMVRMVHVLNSITVHFKSSEQIVILTTFILACSLHLICSSFPYAIVCTSRQSVEATFV